MIALNEARGSRSHDRGGDAIVDAGHDEHGKVMTVRYVLRFALRTAIILGLIVSGWTPAAMSMQRASDCAMMMQSSGATDEGDDMDARAPCPFAAYCAVANVFVAPETAPTTIVFDEASHVLVGLDDFARPEFQPSPLARPPRS